MEAKPSFDNGRSGNDARALRRPWSEPSGQVSESCTTLGTIYVLIPECEGKRFWPPDQLLEK